MRNPFAEYEIWFLTGSQDLYGTETLEQVASQSKAIVDTLNATDNLPLRIIWKPICKDHEGIRKIVRQANNSSRCAGVITWMHTFSPAKTWVAGLKDLQVPLLHLHTQFAKDLPWRTLDMDYMNLNQSAHGDREFGYILTRMGIERKTVVGHCSDPSVAKSISNWMRAACGWRELQKVNVVRIGDNMRYVAVTEGDKVEAEIILGVSVNTWPVNELVDEVLRVSKEAIISLIKEYEELYDVDPKLQKGGEFRESLLEVARQEIALEKFLTDRGASAFTDTFEDLRGLKQLPGLAVQRLMSKGYGFGAEGDWKTALLVRLAKVMGFGLKGGASFMEDYCYDLNPGEELILGAHMLEICPSITTQKPSLEIHPLSIGNREDPVRLKFHADSGNATVVALNDMRDRFRLTVNTVQVIEPIEKLEKLPVACAVWKPLPDFQTSVKCWLAAGGAHHTVMSTQLDLEIWEDFARIAGLELTVIDKETTEQEFIKQLTWNKIYWRERAGL